MFHVHVDIDIGRWYVIVFNFHHNHSLLQEKYCVLLLAHRKMSATNIMQIENFRKVGIKPPHIYVVRVILEVMEGKCPFSIIIDSDVAMKNEIRKVFHICVWHLLRNAMSNVGIPKFMPYLKRCMLSDFDIVEFEQQWNEMVVKSGLEENTWIRELYERRKMWATTHIILSFSVNS
uniref:Protein FAR1-RELATED SEQUENCE n=1 Tax=Cajanus cajan TaxID=3821 RepID=A0A151QXV0_CAJCA|nr:Protein FAR1-RELATED SEQUENCE 7 [Cajanus cajan]